MGLTAQLSVTATTLPTCGIHRQPLASVERASSDPPKTTVVPPQVAQPRTPVQHQQRVVRIVSPKKPSPKTQEKPLPQLLPPLPGIKAIVINDHEGCHNS